MAFLSNNLGNLMCVDIFRRKLILLVTAFSQRCTEDLWGHRREQEVFQRSTSAAKKSTWDSEGTSVLQKHLLLWELSMVLSCLLEKSWWRVKPPSCLGLICLFFFFFQTSLPQPMPGLTQLKHTPSAWPKQTRPKLVYHAFNCWLPCSRLVA